MKAKLQNITGGFICVEMEITDTPIQVVQKAIEQNSADDVAVIFNSATDLDVFKNDSTQVDPVLSTFNLDTKMGVVVLAWNEPISDQAKAEIAEINDAGREFKFSVSITMVVA